MKEVYKGKAKTVYAASDSKQLIMRFRDDISAFDGVKLQSLPDKGTTNNRINAYIMQFLEKRGISTHFIKTLNDTDSLVKNLVMIPVECVVRNVCAGSMTKRYGVPEGTVLRGPIFEFFLKNDELHDPLCNEDHIRILGWTGTWQSAQMKIISLQINEILRALFSSIGLTLVDIKLEFGHDSYGDLVLGDEITPDGCRLWDSKTNEKFDKDRFRRDLGNVVEHYKQIAEKLGPVV